MKAVVLGSLMEQRKMQLMEATMEFRFGSEMEAKKAL